MIECRVCHNQIDATPVEMVVAGGATLSKVMCRYCGTDNTPDVDYPAGINMKYITEPIERNKRVQASMNEAKASKRSKK